MRVLFWSLVISLPALIVLQLLPEGVDPLFLPLVIFMLAVAAVFFLQPWGKRESLRAVFLLDRTLGMEDRGLTAYEILGRKEKKAVDQLVLDEAADRLRAFDPRVTFKKSFSWHGVAAVVLLGLWIAVARFDIGDRLAAQGSEPTLVSRARQLKEFIQPMEEKAETQGLSQTLEITRALQEIAQKGLRKELDEERFREDLAQAMGRLRQMKRDTAVELESALFPLSRGNLESLQAEVEELRRQLRLLPSTAETGRLSPEIQEKIAQLPQLGQALGKNQAPGTSPGEKEMDSADFKRFLDQLEATLKAELERLNQRELQEFLAALLGSSEDREGEKIAKQADGAEGETAEGGEKDRRTGSLPGAQPGEKAKGDQGNAPSVAGSRSQLKGVVGEGQRSRIPIRGQSHVGASKEPTADVLAQYQRQMERDLAAEEIPDALKETIKSYFLSLGESESSR